ncbi:hypothetical protein HQ535_03405 [bacterium]|nr:hypothetical protein [bacterium]
MSEQPGFWERLARKEYDDPVKWNVVPLAPVALLSLFTGDYWLAILIAGVLMLRLWGMRENGYLRRGYQKRYGWD